jgi:xylan 1,4-beta-xylosidase
MLNVELQSALVVWRLVILLQFGGILLSLASAFNCAAAQQYQNPVLRGMNPDPSVVRVGNEYFLATSSFEYFPGCPIYHSFDLVHWQRVGYALGRQEQFAALHSEHPSLYACTLRYHGGVFYATTTDVRGGGNFFVTTTNPAGPWSSPVVVDHGMFDPSLFFDDDGKVYYTRRGPRNGENILQAEIDPSTGKLMTPLRTISTGMISQDAEGPHLYKIGGWYYLSLAEGGSRFLHMETIGRSKSPWGPFAPSPSNPWVSQHTSWDDQVRTLGHCDLIDTPEEKWWAVCLGTRHFNYAHFSLGRETFLFPVRWMDGWPSVAHDDVRSLTVDRAPPGDHLFPATPERDDFAETSLGSDWNTIGPLGMQVISLTERPGYLRLHGQPAELSFQQTTAFVGRRQTEWRTTSTARMEFRPEQSGDRAGLTIFMSPTYHYDICKVWRDGKTYVQLVKQVDDMHIVAAEAPVGQGPLLLRIDSDAEHYRFYYSADQGAWQLLGTGEERLIASEVANVWSGAYLGMFAESQDATHGPPADFDWFDYKYESESRDK